MKSTTTIMDIMQSELIKAGFDEFHQKNELTFFNKEYAFIHKVMSYDDDIEKIVNDMFFKGISLDNHISDKRFKQTFINRFLNRQLAFQTVEAFTSQVIYVLLSHLDYINKIYDDLDDYINAKQKNTTDDGGTNQSDNRYLESDLPQNEINLNVDDTILNYGNRNTISRNKETRTGNSTTNASSYNLDNLIKSNELMADIFDIFDRKCFMQIW